MVTTLSILFGLFFVASIVFVILYSIEYNKHQKTKIELSKKDSDLSTTENKYSLLNKTFNELKSDLLDNKRIGFYEDSITLVSEEDRKANIKGEVYKAHVYVTEVDKYTNGMSKIKLNSIEVISGFSPMSFDWVKSTIKSKFSSIIDTNDVTWLESETDIVQQRSLKITAILDKMKEK